MGEIIVQAGQTISSVLYLYLFLLSALYILFFIDAPYLWYDNYYIKSVFSLLSIIGLIALSIAAAYFLKAESQGDSYSAENGFSWVFWGGIFTATMAFTHTFLIAKEWGHGTWIYTLYLDLFFAEDTVIQGCWITIFTLIMMLIGLRIKSRMNKIC